MLVGIARLSKGPASLLVGLLIWTLGLYSPFARAQVPTPGPSAPETGKRSILLVPLQRAEHVPEGVPVRLEEYLRALISIDPNFKMVDYVPEAVPEEPKEVSPAKVEENPKIVKALEMIETGREKVKKRQFESGLMTLMQAERLLRGQLQALEDFDRYVDCLLWIAVGLVEGGFREEAGPALNKLLVLRPDLILPQGEFSQTFREAAERAKGRLRKDGILQVEVSHASASVFVDGRLLGQGSQTVSGLPQGTHFVRIVLQGHSPVGKFVTVSKGPARVAFKFEESQPKTKERKPRPLTQYAAQGDFGNDFALDARAEAEKRGCEFVLLGYVARSDTAYHLGAFLFDVKSRRTAAIEPAVVDLDLSNLQISLLELEARVAQAAKAFPEDRLVQKRPSIYAIAPSRVGAGPEATFTPPPKATTTPPPTPPVTSGETKVATGSFEELPPDFPLESLVVEEKPTPWYKKWWVWTAIGGVAAVAAGVGLGIGLAKEGGTSKGNTFGGTVAW